MAAAKIKLRAQRRIGEISKTLEKIQTVGGGKVGMPSGGKPKRDVLKSAGLSTSAAMQDSQLQTDAGPGVTFRRPDCGLFT